MNKVNLIGNLAGDPEMRQTQSGIPVCSFTIAINRRTGKDGQRETDFIPIIAWRTLGENCGKYLAKGRKVGVTGSLQTRRYEDKQGNKRTAFEVVAEDVEFLTPAAGAAKPAESNEDFTEMDDTLLPF